MKKRKTKKNRRKGLYRESWEYLVECKNYIFLITALFFGAGLFGFVFADSLTFFNPLLEGLSGKIEGKDLGGLIWFIFQNNLTSAFVAMVGGVAFGALPIFNSILNGSLGGYVYNLASSEAGYGIIVLLLPHGIFELPAVFIALGMGVRFGLFAFARRGHRKKEFTRRFVSSMKAFVAIVLPLLIIAAVVEGFLILGVG
jgi:stage II sporulation protein M